MGTLIQIPFIPKNIGSINTQIETNKSPLENAIINDSLANSTDCKYAPVTILIPIIINADEYILIELKKVIGKKIPTIFSFGCGIGLDYIGAKDVFGEEKIISYFLIYLPVPTFSPLHT